MDATCKIQDNIHVFNLTHKYVSRILGTYHNSPFFYCHLIFIPLKISFTLGELKASLGSNLLLILPIVIFK